MKQFKVNSKNTVYNVFADSEVEAVNKVKEVESKINDETLLNTVNNISRWAGGNSQINRILSSGKKVTASQIVSLYEKNKGIKISNPNQRSQITSLVGRLSGFARDSVEVGDAIMVYSFETIKENGSKGSISVRASSEQEAKVEAEKLLKREINIFGAKMKLGKIYNSYKVGDSKVNDAYDIKPGAIFKTKRGDYYKVVRINNDKKVEWNFIGKPYNQKSGNQFEVFGYQENSIERFKEILSHSSARPVNSLYDSKSLQEVK